MTPLPTFLLASGREVRLERLIIEDTYAGAEAEDPDELRAEVISGHVKLVEDLYDDETPLLLIEPPDGPLPKVAMMATLVSDKPVGGGDREAQSYLVVCWYRDNFPVDVPGAIDAVVKDIDWDGNAIDFMW